MAYLNPLIQLLHVHQWKVCTAESCTGGMLAEQLTAISGSSQWFEGGFVSYSNEAKHHMLAVPDELIIRHGAVSEEVAEAMAIGGVRNSNADCCVSVTGVAGPTGGSVEKPVGTVCFGFYHRKNTPVTMKKFFPDKDRQAIREQSCRFAIEHLLDYLKTSV